MSDFVLKCRIGFPLFSGGSLDDFFVCQSWRERVKVDLHTAGSSSGRFSVPVR